MPLHLADAVPVDRADHLGLDPRPPRTPESPSESPTSAVPTQSPTTADATLSSSRRPPRTRHRRRPRFHSTGPVAGNDLSRPEQPTHARTRTTMTSRLAYPFFFIFYFLVCTRGPFRGSAYYTELVSIADHALTFPQHRARPPRCHTNPTPNQHPLTRAHSAPCSAPCLRYLASINIGLSNDISRYPASSFWPPSFRVAGSPSGPANIAGHGLTTAVSSGQSPCLHDSGLLAGPDNDLPDPQLRWCQYWSFGPSGRPSSSATLCSTHHQLCVRLPQHRSFYVL